MKNKLILLSLFIALFSGCNSGSKPDMSGSGGAGTTTVSTEMAKSSSSEGEAATDEVQGEESVAPADPPQMPSPGTPKKLIKNADIRIKVDDLQKAESYVNNQVKLAGAYIASNNSDNTAGFRTISLQIRVDYRKFESLMAHITPEGGFVDSKKISSQDVTSEYVDVESRIKSKKAVEARYRELLKEAHSIKDIIEVEDKLRLITEETEIQEGRMKYLTDQTSYSTINLELHQEDTITAHSESFWGRIASSIIYGWEIFSTFLLVVIGAWPFLIVAGLVLYFIRQYQKRRELKK